MSANGYAISATVRNAVFLQRLAAGEAKKVQSVLLAMQRDINSVLNSATDADFNSGRVLFEVERITSERLDEVSTMVKESAAESAVYFSAFTSKLLSKVSKITPKTPDPRDVQLSLLTASLDLKMKGGNMSLNDAVNEFGQKKAQQFRQVVSDGMLNGATGVEIRDQVSELMQLNLRQAETLVRTTTNSAAQVGRLQTFKENDDVLLGVENVAVLDSRTTDFCKAIDGKIQSLSDASRPPYHWGCRTQLVPVVKPQFQDPTASGERNAEGGKVTPNTTYGAWLKHQPEAFQVEALGKERALLFRKGGLDVGSFVDMESGQTYTLEKLRNLEPMAFEKAGL